MRLEYFLLILTVITADDDSTMIREASSGRTMFLPSEVTSLEWRLNVRGDGEDFMGIVRNGEFTIDSCGPFVQTHVLDPSGVNVQGFKQITVPFDEGVYNVYVFRKNSVLSSSHTYLADCQDLTSGFDVVAQYDIVVNDNETAVIFDGENDFASLSLSSCTSEFTFETWIRCHGDCSNQEILSIPECHNISISLGDNFQYIDHDDRIVYATSRGSIGTTMSMIGNDETITTRATSYGLVTDGRWHHIAAVVSNRTVVIYVDGVPGEYIPWNPPTSSYRNDNVSLILGSSFRGTISETRLWYKVRSMSEIRSQMYVRVSNNNSISRVWSFLSHDVELDSTIEFHGDTNVTIALTPFSSQAHDIGVSITCDTVATELPLLSTLSLTGSGTTRIQCPFASGVSSPWERWCGGTNTTQTPIYGENTINGYADISHPCMAAWHAAMLMQESILASPIIFDLNWMNTLISTFSSTTSEFPPLVTSQSLANDERPAFKVRNAIVGYKAGAVEIDEIGNYVSTFVSIGHQPLCRGLRSLVNGLCYYLIPQKYLWSDAKEACQVWGGRIAQVRTQYDRSFIESMISQYETENPLEDSLHPMWISTDPYDEFGLYIDIFNQTGSEEDWELCVQATNCRFPVMCERVLRVDMQYLLPVSPQTDVKSITVGDPDLPPNPLLMTKTALDWNDGTDTLKIKCNDDNMVEGARHGDTIVIRGIPGDPTFVANPMFLPVVIVSDDDEAELQIDWDSRPIHVSDQDAVTMSLESSCVQSCPVPKAFEWGSKGEAKLRLSKMSWQDCEGFLDRELGGSCFVSFLNECQNREDAHQTCVDIGASLVSVNSIKEATMLSTLLHIVISADKIWIGSKRVDDNWIYEDNSDSSLLRSRFLQHNESLISATSNFLVTNVEHNNNESGFLIYDLNRNRTIFSSIYDNNLEDEDDDNLCLPFVCERHSETTIEFFDRTTELTWPQIEPPEKMILYSHNWNEWHYFDVIAADDEIVETEVLTNMPLEARVVNASRGEVFGGTSITPLLPTLDSHPEMSLQGITDTLRVLIIDDDNRADAKFESIPVDMPRTWNGGFTGVEADGLRRFKITLTSQPASDVFVSINLDPFTDRCIVTPQNFTFLHDAWPQTFFISVDVPETQEIDDVDMHTTLVLSTQSEDVFFNGSMMMLQMRDDFRHRIGMQWSDLHGTTLSERCTGFNLDGSLDDDFEAEKMNQALWFDSGKGLAITNSMDLSNGGVLEFTIRTRMNDTMSSSSSSDVMLEVIMEQWQYAGCWTRQEINAINPLTGVPTNWSWYVDALPVYGANNPVYSPYAEKCAEQCSSYAYFGFASNGNGSLSQNCWCGNDMKRGTVNVDEQYCNVPCTDYSTGNACSSDIRTVAVYAREIKTQWEYTGCYRRSHVQRFRDLAGKVYTLEDTFERPMEIHTLSKPSLRLCGTICVRQYFGLSFESDGTTKCFCSDALNMETGGAEAVSSELYCEVNMCTDNEDDDDDMTMPCGSYEPPHAQASVLHTGTQYIAVYRRLNTMNVIKDAIERLDIVAGRTDTDWVNAETLLADGDFRNTGWRSYPGDNPLHLDFVLDDTHCISRASISWLVPGQVGQNAYIPTSLNLLVDEQMVWSGTFTSQGDGDPVERQRVVDVWDRVLAITDDLKFDFISAKKITLQISGLVRNSFRINEFSVFGIYGPCHTSIYRSSPVLIQNLISDLSSVPSNTTCDGRFAHQTYSIDLALSFQKPVLSFQWSNSKPSSLTWALDDVNILANRDVRLDLMEFRIVCDEFSDDGINGTVVEEGGNVAYYYISVVSLLPQEPVTIHIEPQTRWDNREQLVVNPETVTFVASNASDKVRIRVEAVDDDLYEFGNHWAMIHHSVKNHSRYVYKRMFRSINVSIIENDVAGVLISRQSLNVTEADGGYYNFEYLPIGMPEYSTFEETYSIRLNSEPFTQVQVPIHFDEINLEIVPSVVEIEPLNWNQDHVVTVRAVEDYIDEGIDHMNKYVVVHNVSSDGDLVYASLESLYSHQGILPDNLTVTVVDDDEAAVLVSDRTVRFSGSTEYDTLNFTLASRPTSTVNVTIIIGSLSGNYEISQDFLMFEPEEWRSQRQIQIHRIFSPDEKIYGAMMYTTGPSTNLLLGDGNHSRRRRLEVAHLGYQIRSDDSNYEAINVSVAKTNGYQSDDVVILKSHPRLVAEGEGKHANSSINALDFYSVLLAQKPIAPIYVECFSGLESRLKLLDDIDATWSTELKLYFDASNWTMERLVAFRAYDDKYWELAHEDTVQHLTNWNSRWHGAVPISIPNVRYNIDDRDAVLLAFSYVDPNYPQSLLSSDPTYTDVMRFDFVNSTHAFVPTHNEDENVTMRSYPLDMYGNLMPLSESLDSNREGLKSQFTAKRGCELIIAEGSSIVMYAVVLSHEPLGDVVITIRPTCDGQIILFQNETVWLDQSWVKHPDMGREYELTFTSSDWNIPRLVPVQSIQDKESMSTQYCTIEHHIRSEEDIHFNIVLNDFERSDVVPNEEICSSEFGRAVSSSSPIGTNEEPEGAIFFAPVVSRHAFGGVIGIQLISDDPWWLRQNLWRISGVILSLLSMITIAYAILNSMRSPTTARPTGDTLAYIWTLQFTALSGGVPFLQQNTEVLDTFTGSFDWTIARIGDVIVTPDQQTQWHEFVSQYFDDKLSAEFAEPLLVSLTVLAAAVLLRIAISFVMSCITRRAWRHVPEYPPSTYPLAGAVDMQPVKTWKDPIHRADAFAGHVKKQNKIRQKCAESYRLHEPARFTRWRNNMLDVGLRSKFPKWELTVMLFLAPGICLGSAAVAFKETHLSDVEQRLGMTIFAFTVFILPVFLFLFLFLYVFRETRVLFKSKHRKRWEDLEGRIGFKYKYGLLFDRLQKRRGAMFFHAWMWTKLFCFAAFIGFLRTNENSPSITTETFENITEKGCIVFCVLEILQILYVVIYRPYIAFLNNVQCVLGSMYRFGTLSLAIALKYGTSQLLIEPILLFWTTYMVAFFIIREMFRMYLDLRIESLTFKFEYNKLHEFDKDLKTLARTVKDWIHKEKHGHFTEERLAKQIEKMVAEKEEEEEKERKQKEMEESEKRLLLVAKQSKRTLVQENDVEETVFEDDDDDDDDGVGKKEHEEEKEEEKKVDVDDEAKKEEEETTAVVE